MISNSLSGLGLMYEKLGDHEAALKFHQEDLKHCTDLQLIDLQVIYMKIIFVNVSYCFI